MRFNQLYRFFLLVGKKNQCGLRRFRAGALAGLAKGAGHFFSRTDIMTTFSTAATSAGKMQPLRRAVAFCLLFCETKSRSREQYAVLRERKALRRAQSRKDKDFFISLFSIKNSDAQRKKPSARVCLCLLSAHTESRSRKGRSPASESGEAPPPSHSSDKHL